MSKLISWHFASPSHEVQLDTSFRDALKRATAPKQTEADIKAQRQTAIDHKYKIMRETGYDQAWQNRRRKTDKWNLGICLLLIIAGWLVILGLLYGLIQLYLTQSLTG